MCTWLQATRPHAAWFHYLWNQMCSFIPPSLLLWSISAPPLAWFVGISPYMVLLHWPTALSTGNPEIMPLSSIQNPPVTPISLKKKQTLQEPPPHSHIFYITLFTSLLISLHLSPLQHKAKLGSSSFWNIPSMISSGVLCLEYSIPDICLAKFHVLASLHSKAPFLLPDLHI